MGSVQQGLMAPLADAWRYVAGAGPDNLQGHLAPLAPLAGRPFSLEELAAIMGPLDYEIAVAMQPAGDNTYELARAFSQGKPSGASYMGYGDYEMAHNHPGQTIAHGISPGDVQSWRGLPAAHVMAGGGYQSFDRDSIEQMLELMKQGQPLLTAGQGRIEQ